MDKPVLGLNFGTHDAAAAIVSGGKVIAAAEEERFTRHKQTKAFPLHAARYCLREAAAYPADLRCIALFVDPKRQLLLPLTNLYHGFPHSVGSLLSDLHKYQARRSALSRIKDSELFRPGCRVITVAHHLAHAASAYLPSPFDDAVVVTIDGRGEYETACIFEGRDGHLVRRHHVVYPHSIGYLYSMVTRYLGFRPQRDEYKVMGLAAYGSPALVQRFGDLARFDARSGRLRLNLSYFDHHRRPSDRRRLYSQKLIAQLGAPRNPGEPITDRHRDIAHALQKLTEHLVCQYVGFAQRLIPLRSLCLAGGVALNGVANAALIESGQFDGIYVQPAANDAGTSLGAALHCATADGRGGPRMALDHTFLGPAYDDGAIKAALSRLHSSGHLVSRVSDPHGCAAQLLAQGKVIGWFQGRMEFGPRALGARSILAPATDPSIATRINAMIKRREQFRPLAPAVLEEQAAEYFDVRGAGRYVYPFMLATASTRSSKWAAIPSVVHVDGSARVQTVSRSSNPQLWTLIEAYRRRTGIPVILNTSLNGADEPMACTPQDAVNTFINSGLDALVAGGYVVQRPGQPGQGRRER